MGCCGQGMTVRAIVVVPCGPGRVPSGPIGPGIWVTVHQWTLGVLELRLSRRAIHWWVGQLSQRIWAVGSHRGEGWTGSEDHSAMDGIWQRQDQRCEVERNKELLEQERFIHWRWEPLDGQGTGR